MKAHSNLESFINVFPKEICTLLTHLETIRKALCQLDICELNTGFCHGDINPTNFRICPAGNPFALDFDCCGYGLRAFDISGLLWSITIAGSGVLLWNSFCSGYHETLYLPAREVAAVNTFAHLWGFWAFNLRMESSPIYGTRIYDSLFFKRWYRHYYHLPKIHK